MFFSSHYRRRSGDWEIAEFPIVHEYWLRIIIGPGYKNVRWHIIGPIGFKSIDLLSFAPENTTAVVGGHLLGSSVRMWKDGRNNIVLEDFEDPLWIIWVLYHEIGHIWSYRLGKKSSKTYAQEERDAWAYAFWMLRKLLRVCGVQPLDRDRKRKFLKEIYARNWAQLPHKGKTI
jgi:hypothetical protein